MGRARKIAGIRILDRLYDRGMAIVYRGRSSKYGDVAIKVPKEGVDLASFVYEAKLQKRLEHEHIVRAHEVGEVEGQPCLVMEYVAAPTLAMIVEQYQPGLPMLSARAIAAIGLRVCEALDFAYRAGGIAAHCDIKPNNIFAQVRGDEVTLVKLTDFGIAKPTGEDELATRVVGAPYYMAPEQLVGRSDISQRTDIYSLGCVLYELAAGCRPFEGNQYQVMSAHQRVNPAAPRRHRPELPQELSDVIMRCLAKRPADRYGSVAELAAALSQLLTVLPPGPAAEPVIVPPRTPQPAERPSAIFRDATDRVLRPPEPSKPPTQGPKLPWAVIAVAAVLAVVVVGGAVLLVIASMAEVQVYKFTAAWSLKNGGVTLTWRMRRKSAFSSRDLTGDEAKQYRVTVCSAAGDQTGSDLEEGTPLKLPRIYGQDGTVTCTDRDADPGQVRTYWVCLARKGQRGSGEPQDVKLVGQFTGIRRLDDLLKGPLPTDLATCRASIKALDDAASALLPPVLPLEPDRRPEKLDEFIGNYWKDGGKRRQALDYAALSAAVQTIMSGRTLSDDDLRFFAELARLRKGDTASACEALPKAMDLREKVLRVVRRPLSNRRDELNSVGHEVDRLSGRVTQEQPSSPGPVRPLFSDLPAKLRDFRGEVQKAIAGIDDAEAVAKWGDSLRELLGKLGGETVAARAGGLRALAVHLANMPEARHLLNQVELEAARKRIEGEANDLGRLALKGVCAQAAKEARGVLGEVADLGFGNPLTDDDDRAVQGLLQAQSSAGTPLSRLKSSWGPIRAVHSGLPGIASRVKSQAEMSAAAEHLRNAAAGVGDLEAMVAVGHQLGRAKLAMPQQGERDVQSLRKARGELAQVLDSLRRITTGRDSDAGKLRDEVSRRLAATCDAMASTIVAEVNAGYGRAIKAAQAAVDKPGPGSTVEACGKNIAALAKGMDAVGEHQKAFERREDISPANADGAKAFLADAQRRVGQEARAAFDLAIKPLCSDKLESTLADVRALDGVLADARKAEGEGVDAVHSAWAQARKLSASRQTAAPATSDGLEDALRDLDRTIAALKGEYRADMLRALFAVEKGRLRWAYMEPRSSSLTTDDVDKAVAWFEEAIKPHLPPLPPPDRKKVLAVSVEVTRRIGALVVPPPPELVALEKWLDAHKEDGKTIVERKDNIVELVPLAQPVIVMKKPGTYPQEVCARAGAAVGGSKAKAARELEGMLAEVVDAISRGSSNRPTKGEEDDFQDALRKLKSGELVDAGVVGLVEGALDAALAVRGARQASKPRSPQEANGLLSGLGRAEASADRLAQEGPDTLQKHGEALKVICSRSYADVVCAFSPYVKTASDEGGHLTQLHARIVAWGRTHKEPPGVRDVRLAIDARLKELQDHGPRIRLARAKWEETTDKARELTEALRVGRPEEWMRKVDAAVKAYKAAKEAGEKVPQAELGQFRKEQDHAARELGSGLSVAGERLILAAEREAVEREAKKFLKDNRQYFKARQPWGLLQDACDQYCRKPREVPVSKEAMELFSAAGCCCQTAEETGLRSDVLGKVWERAEAGKKGVMQGLALDNLRGTIKDQMGGTANFHSKLHYIVGKVLGHTKEAMWAPGTIATAQAARMEWVKRALEDFADAEKAAPKTTTHAEILAAMAEELMGHYDPSLEGNYGLDDANLRKALSEALRSRNRNESPTVFRVQDFLDDHLERRAKEPKSRVAGKEKTSGGSRLGAAEETVAAGGP